MIGTTYDQKFRIIMEFLGVIAIAVILRLNNRSNIITLSDYLGSIYERVTGERFFFFDKGETNGN